MASISGNVELQNSERNTKVKCLDRLEIKIDTHSFTHHSLYIFSQISINVMPSLLLSTSCVGYQHTRLDVNPTKDK